MDLNDSLLAELKKLTQELASHKIELYQTRHCLQCIVQNSTDSISARDAEGSLETMVFKSLKERTRPPTQA